MRAGLCGYRAGSITHLQVMFCFCNFAGKLGEGVIIRFFFNLKIFALIHFQPVGNCHCAVSFRFGLRRASWNLGLYFSSNMGEFWPPCPGVSPLTQPPALLPGTPQCHIKHWVWLPLPALTSPPRFSASPVLLKLTSLSSTCLMCCGLVEGVFNFRDSIFLSSKIPLGPLL